MDQVAHVAIITFYFFLFMLLWIIHFFKHTLKFFFFFLIFTDFREGGRYREREMSICCSTYYMCSCVLWLILVAPWLGIQPTTLAHQDDAVTSWATRLGLMTEVLKYIWSLYSCGKSQLLHLFLKWTIILNCSHLVIGIHAYNACPKWLNSFVQLCCIPWLLMAF